MDILSKYDDFVFFGLNSFRKTKMFHNQMVQIIISNAYNKIVDQGLWPRLIMEKTVIVLENGPYSKKRSDFVLIVLSQLFICEFCSSLT